MTPSFYDVSVRTYQQIVGATAGFLAKGSEHFAAEGTDLAEVARARLRDDMATLQSRCSAWRTTRLALSRGCNRASSCRPPAAAAGAPLPEDRKIDGVDLVPLATGEATGVPHEALFWRSGASQSALVDGWKLSVSDPPGRSWLFDLRADPTERRDLSEERPDKLAELQAALAGHNAEQAEPAWPSQLMVPVNIDKDLTQPDSPDDEYIYWSN